MPAKWIARIALLLGLAIGGPAAATTNTDRVVREMCGKRVALLGESPVHGFAKTLEFKVELVERLVNECHFNAVLWEGGIYDFLNAREQMKSGHEVNDAMIATAIGGIWSNKEVQPLIPFLRERMASARLYLGGLDDQLSRGSWAQKEMPAALVESLSGDEKARCLAVLQKHTLYQYTSDAPYGAQDKARIVDCLDAMTARWKATNSADRDDRLAMIESLKRSLDRDFPNVPQGMDADTWWTNARDRSLYLNFRWHLSQLPPRSKVIVWAATVHTAKDLSGVSTLEKRVPLGSYIHHDFGSQAFSLGFSAYTGSYAFVGRPVQELSPAPGNSLESRSFASGDGDTVYLSQKELRKAGTIATRATGAKFMTARWDEVVDGLVIFRSERAPEYLKH